MWVEMEIEEEEGGRRRGTQGTDYLSAWGRAQVKRHHYPGGCVCEAVLCDAKHVTAQVYLCLFLYLIY